MELRHLRYFLAVAEASNFTKAAAQLQVAQPALSRQVKHLEDEIGVELLSRSPRGVTLTAEGRLFLKEARQLLKGAGESVENVRALDQEYRSEFRSIGYSTPAYSQHPVRTAGECVAPAGIRRRRSNIYLSSLPHVGSGAACRPYC